MTVLFYCFTLYGIYVMNNYIVYIYEKLISSFQNALSFSILSVNIIYFSSEVAWLFKIEESLILILLSFILIDILPIVINSFSSIIKLVLWSVIFRIYHKINVVMVRVSNSMSLYKVRFIHSLSRDWSWVNNNWSSSIIPLMTFTLNHSISMFRWLMTLRSMTVREISMGSWTLINTVR